MQWSTTGIIESTVTSRGLPGVHQSSWMCSEIARTVFSSPRIASPRPAYFLVFIWFFSYESVRTCPKLSGMPTSFARRIAASTAASAAWTVVMLRVSTPIAVAMRA